MKHVSILLLEQANLAGLENARQGFGETNRFQLQKGLKEIFWVELIGKSYNEKFNNGKVIVQSDRRISEAKKTDIIIIPPIEGDIQPAIESNSEFIPWIIRQYNNGARIASLCTGTFILAQSGLLDGKSCVTHWRAAEAFKKQFPKVNLLTEKLLTHENRIFTGGGAFSSANLMLYLIEKVVDKETAVYCSKVLQIDFGRNSQSPFMIFEGQKSHCDQSVIKAQTFIEENYHSKITIDELAESLGIGRRTFERRFKKATSNTVIEYIQRTRIEAAKKQLENGYKNISEIMYEVGYSDPKSFRNIFKKVSGESPMDYQKRYKNILQN